MSTQGQEDVVRAYEPGDAKIQIIGVIRLEDGEEYKGALLTFPAGPPDMKVLAAWDGTPYRIVPAEEYARLRTLLSSSRGEQGWRTMDVERLIVSAYVRGHQWCHENGVDHGLIDKAARDYADYVISTRAASAPGSVPTSLAGQGTDGYVLAPRRMNDTMLEAARGTLPGICDDLCDADIEDIYETALSVAPQPTAGGDVPWECNARVTNYGDPKDCNWPDCGCDPHAERVMKSAREHGWYSPGDFEEAEAEHKDALSAERARVIEECAKVAEAEAAKARSRGALDISQEYASPLRVAAALRALAQQDTGGAK